MTFSLSAKQDKVHGEPCNHREVRFGYPTDYYEFGNIYLVLCQTYTPNE